MSKLTKDKFYEETDRIVGQANGFKFTRTHVYIAVGVLALVALKLLGVI